MFVGTQTADNVSRGGKYEEIEWMYTCGPKISQCPAMDGQTISLDDFRSQYIERVLALLGRDVHKAASTLGLPDREIESIVGHEGTGA